jgi:hypothetical protein
VWAVPSSSFSVKTRHVPAQSLLVFHT